MDEGIDRKIHQVLQELQAASADFTNRFIHPVVQGQETVADDYFELAYAQDKISSLEVQLQLYLSEQNPERFTAESIADLKAEKLRLEKRMRALKQKQIPTRE